MTEKTKKRLSVVKSFLVWLVVAVTVFIMIFTLVSVTMFDQNNRHLFSVEFMGIQ